MKHNSIYLFIINLCIFWLCLTSQVASQPEFIASPNLPDISGLAWIENNLFLAVHDTKSSSNQPRISLINLPEQNHPLLWKPIIFDWHGQPSQDLESIAKIPNTNFFLLAESGNSRRQKSPRIFLVEYHQNQLTLVKTLAWPTKINNVEGIAVTQIDDHYIFLYAERAPGKTLTKIHYCHLQLQPFSFGKFQEIPLEISLPTNLIFRPISSIEIDEQSNIYIASAFDPNDNNGPFQSIIWKIGQIQVKQSAVIFRQNIEKIAVVDGFKVESLAIQQLKTGKRRLLIGTDEENYGGTVRILGVF